MKPLRVTSYQFNFKDEFKDESTDIYYRKMKYDIYKSGTFKCLHNNRWFYVKLFTLMVFFYDSMPMVDNFYMITAESNKIGCPLYFTVDFNESITNCDQVKWYHLNETYVNGKTIQCIGTSPYKLENDKIVKDCSFSFTTNLCKNLAL